MNTTKHQYLMTLIRELEKEGTIKLDNFTMFVEETLQVKYKLRNYFNYPISEPQYDELIDYAEQLLDIDPATSGRTKGATSAHGASSDVDSFNTMTDIEVEALVDYALVDMKLVKHVLKNYTPDQLTIDIIKEAAAGHMVDGVRVNVIDGMKVNKQTANYIEMKIKEIQNAGSSDNGLYSDQWIAFTAKQDIKQGDFVVIDEQDNQSVIPAAQMEVSDTTLEDLKKGQPDYKLKTIDVDELIKDAALGKGYHYGAIYNFDEAKAILDKAPQELKMIWYYSPFQQFFIGDITAMTDFPFIYKNEDPSHSDYVKNTAVVGPFYSVEELDNYFDLMVREKVGIDDAYFTNNLAELVVAIKFYESRNDAGKYSIIIDNLWRELKSMLLGNI
jgi:tetratricopeptide (TPR) repeat protein